MPVGVNFKRIFPGRSRTQRLPAFAPPIGVSRLFFGDSVFLRVSRGDIDQSSLAELLVNNYRAKDKGAYVFAYSALALPHFLLYLLSLGDKVEEFEKIVIPLNYRSFSRQWECNPSWKYMDCAEKLNNSLGTSSVNIDCLFDKADYASSRASYYFFGEQQTNYFLDAINQKTETLDSLLEKRKKIMAFNYLFGKETLFSSKRLNSIDLICEKFGYLINKIFFVILPVNVQGVEFLFGCEAVEYLDHNFKLMNDWLRARGLNVLDCSHSLDRFGFFNVLEATDHLNSSGRRAICSSLSNI